MLAATGLYSLLRFAARLSAAQAGNDRVAALAHLLMSVAMIAMTWAFSGGPDNRRLGRSCTAAERPAPPYGSADSQNSWMSEDPATSRSNPTPRPR